MTALLEVDGLRLRYRIKGELAAWIEGMDAFIDAVQGVSFHVREGETFAVVGESGSGKTTLAQAIAGLVPAQEGSVRFEGTELRGLSERALKKHRRHMAFLFQDAISSLSPRLRVSSLLMEPFEIHGLKDLDPKAETMRLLETVGLSADFGDRFPHQLSGGQARRVGLARALALSPKLIIADEPTAGLDVSVQGEVLNLLAALQAKLGISVMIITHNLNVVRHIAHRMAIMYLGRFVEEGPTDDIFRRPRHPYTLALLSASPKPDPDAVPERLELRGEIPSLLNRPQGCEFHPRCPFVQDDCRTTPPALTNESPEHRYRCHHALDREAWSGAPRGPSLTL